MLSSVFAQLTFYTQKKKKKKLILIKSSGEPSVCSACGDRRITGTETCDDGNARGGDGCSADCSEVEVGFLCGESTVVPGMSSCWSCGNGNVEGAELCDDGNTAEYVMAG
jgi:cysteine-rich repeat protein